MTPEQEIILSNILYFIGIAAIVIVVIWILTYDSRNNYGLKKGDKFLDTRWK
jgi:hypothetical protein